MTIPTGFVQFSVLWDPQVSLPNGAAITFGCENSTGLGVEDLLGECNEAFWTDGDMKAAFGTNVTSAAIRVKKGPDATGASGQATHNNVGTGASAAGAAAPSILVRKNTASGGRKNRGRMYLPGIAEGSIDAGGVVASGTVTGIQSRVNDFFDSLDTRQLPMYILHDGSDAPTICTSLTVEALVATQRRRQRR